MTNTKYFMVTGQYEHLRLSVLNKIYNPDTLDFLAASGLKKGMTVMEFGCGAGLFAIELAKYLGNEGKIIAIDSSEDLLNNARDNAKNANVYNIEFRLCNIEDMSNLSQKFDFIYGRWVLIFTHNVKKILAQLIEHLKPGGQLICEELNFAKSGHFSYPHETAVDKYHQLVLDNCIASKLNINLANTLYHEFKQQQLTSISIKANQPIITTAEEKIIYRLGLITMSKAILNNKLCSETELQNLNDRFSEIEKSDTIIGCFRNLLVRGIRPL